MDEALVKDLVARILADPRFQAMLSSGRSTPKEMKPTALIVVTNEEGLMALPDLQRRWGDCCSLQLCLIGSMVAPITTIPKVECGQVMEIPGLSRILIPVCSGGQLAQIALGLRQDDLSNIVGHAILQGIPVEINRVDFGYTERTPVSYRQLLEGYQKQAEKYGVIVGSIVQPKLPLQESPTVPVLSAPIPCYAVEPLISVDINRKTDINYEKKLMTEKDAILFPDCAVLKLTRSTVMTPAAIDVLKSRKIQVYREGVRYL